MRITKDYDERKNEILDVAEKLFYQKGYEKCTVNDILKQVNIAKGTFYYYFKSKEEVLEGVVDRISEIILTRIESILDNKTIPVEEKLARAFLAMSIKDQISTDVLESMHQSNNALMHQYILNQMVNKLAPIICQIVEQGIAENKWNCRFPYEYMQIFLVATLTLTDEGIFEQTPEKQQTLIMAFVSMMEDMLSIQEGEFLNLFGKLQNSGEGSGHE